MSFFKCKMCGGTIEFNQGDTIGICDSCGTKQTLPKTDNEVISNLFNRANNLRLKCEFDKAAQIYEKIVEQDNSEAEAHWGIVLCKYGIEYVEDPKTFTRIPTCHRTLFGAVTTDADYLAAIEHADGGQRAIYESEARAIDAIQRDILAIVKNEQPFDVFICYKETDQNGKRTIDSTIANDIYYQLTQEGFKVFFAAITLEDKLGQEYEPYIFAALNSAKVMLVLGTKPEYFSAVWVKNEWSRFLHLMKADRSKLLIPCYRDMDAYDLPEEFSHLQAQDMGKIGFINDVVRGIKKVMGEEPVAPVPREPVVMAGATNVAPLLKRAFMFLEDGEWEKADEFCEQVLNQEPQNAEAYLGKLMAELRVRKQEALKDCGEPFDDRNNYQKAVRFGKPDLVQRLTDAVAFIKERNEEQRLDRIYGFAMIQMELNTISGYEDAKKYLNSIPDWKDAQAQLSVCDQKLEELRVQAEEKERERQAAMIVRKKRLKIIAAIGIPLVALLIAFVLLMNYIIIPNGKYEDAVALMNAGKYTEAIYAFEAMNGYKDSAEKIQECNTAILDGKYEAAVDLMESERYTEAITAFEKLNGYKDSKTMILECKYAQAVSLMALEKYTEAISVFKSLNDYKDSAAKITACETAMKDQQYNNALSLMNAGKYTEAITAFKTLNGYKDSAAKISVCETALKEQQYNNAVLLMNTRKYVAAYKSFASLNGYKDSANKMAELMNLSPQVRIYKTSVGGVVTFGAYEQDNNTSNGREAIEWIVLDKKDGKALLISKYGLDCQPYNTSSTSVTWETCTLRSWLNTTFYTTAFNADQQSVIASTTLMNPDNPSYDTDGGNNTTDKVFLLSIDEAKKYFASNSARQCTATAYAKALGAYEDDGCSLWWLRSPGGHSSSAAYVTFTGSVVGNYGSYVHNAYAVRPALWVDIS